MKRTTLLSLVVLTVAGLAAPAVAEPRPQPPARSEARSGRGDDPSRASRPLRQRRGPRYGAPRQGAPRQIAPRGSVRQAPRQGYVPRRSYVPRRHHDPYVAPPVYGPGPYGGPYHGPRSYYDPAPGYVPYGEPRGTVVAEPAYARDPFVRGYLGLGAAVGWLGGSTGVRSFGTSGGFDLHGGLEIGRWAAVELGWRFLATRDDVRERALLNAITLGAKAYLLPDGIVKPYVFGGVGVFVLSPLTAAHDAPVGPGLDLGIGADFNLSDHFALGARLSWRPAFLDEADLGLPTGSGVATLHDVSWTMRAQVRF